MQTLRVWRKSLFIGLAAIFISTLSIQAGDQLSGVSSRLLGSVIDSQITCEENTTMFLVGERVVCIDTYEASPNENCVYLDPLSSQETLANLAKPTCQAKSVPGVMPWRFVTYTEAQLLCARAGKRLLTNNEWYKNALSIADTSLCFTSTLNEPAKTGANNCFSQNGVSDLVGNVWEWTEEVVTDGGVNDRILPESGYVSLVDNDGLVLETSAAPSQSFGADYAWVTKNGVRGILRGGFYGSGEDGGIFAQNISVPLNFSAAGVGFRCVRDLI